MIFDCLVNEFVNFIRYLLSLVEQSLLLVILPVQSKVLHADSLPKIAQLSSCCVHYSGNFVGNYKLEVLKNMMMSKKTNTKLPFERSNYIDRQAREHLTCHKVEYLLT